MLKQLMLGCVAGATMSATARHADIVLPPRAAQERMDFGAGQTDNILVPMPKAVDPPGQARQEYDIYSDLAQRLGTYEAFTEGRDTEGWLRHIWAQTQDAAKANGFGLPDWDRFITGGIVELPDPTPNRVFLSEFRADPQAAARLTPSGRIELFSSKVAGFDLPDCRGHATWNAPRDQSHGEFPLALISGQPGTRLHSQYDNGTTSKAQKIKGREPVLINPADAGARGIANGDIVELFNDRGRCLAGARVTEDMAQGCVFLWTGAWYDPEFAAHHHRDRHGNPNVLTHDRRTSDFSQSPAAHSAQVDLRKFDAEPPDICAHDAPHFVQAPELAKDSP